MSLSYRNQSTDLQSKSVDWFLYDRALHQEWINFVSRNHCITKEEERWYAEAAHLAQVDLRRAVTVAFMPLEK